MISKKFKFKLKRVIRRRRKDAIEIADNAEDNLEKLFFRRLKRLENVRRFVIGWIALLVLLIASVGLQARGLGGYYQKIAPVEGGTLREGMMGTFSNANPLYAVNAVDGSVSKMLFSGLFTHDANDQLVPDLADKWESDEKGQQYTVSLRKNVQWHDGTPFTSADVLYTYKTIQKPDAKSPLLSSWQGVDVTVKDEYTVVFSLPSPLASFPYSLTNGIVPKHILSAMPDSQLRSVPFNSVSPIGTGPFQWSRVEVSGTSRETRNEQIALKKYNRYHLGAPKIDQYVLRTFKDERALINAYTNKELTSIVGLDTVPEEVVSDTNSTIYNVPTNGSVMVFFNNTNEYLADVKLRQALSYATNKPELINKLGFTALTTDSPLLKSHIGYDKSVTQLSYNQAEATKLLDAAGWVTGDDGLRRKGDKTLTLRLVSQNNAEFTAISQELQNQWKNIGVALDVKLRPEEEMQSDVLGRHDYDVLLYGISLGNDPDVFAYWHSTQADVRSASRLNFSEYKSTNADKALEAGRTRIDPSVRAVKYKPFLQAWRDDAPAISLYQPRVLYIARSELVGFNAKRLNSTIDRLNGIQTWTVIQDRVLR